MYEGTSDDRSAAVRAGKARAWGRRAPSGERSSRDMPRPGSVRRAASPVIDTQSWLESRGVSARRKSAPPAYGDFAEERFHDEGLSAFIDVLRADPWRVAGWLMARWWLIALLTVLGAVAGYGAVLVIKPRFTASIDLLVDPSNLKVVANDLFTDSSQRDNQLLDVGSKLRIVTSGNVLSRVIADLNLEDDPEFVSPSSKAPSEDALTALERRLTARRDERSFIVNISVWSQSREKSVDIANSVARHFQEELAKGESDGAGRAASALIARLDSLKAEVTQAESNVEAFKKEHGLQSISGELASTLMSQQTNTQLVQAKERLIQAQTRVSKLMSADPVNGGGAESLQSETLTLLRTQYAALKQRATAEATVLGPLHPSTKALQPQIKALEQQIRLETNRMVQAAKVELAQAQTALDALTSEADQMRSTVFTDTTAQIQLRELEREARAKAAVYESFMARAGETAERQQIDTTNVRVVSPATVPTNRSFPPRGSILAAGGGVAGFGLGLILAGLLGLLQDHRRWSRDGYYV